MLVEEEASEVACLGYTLQPPSILEKIESSYAYGYLPTNLQVWLGASGKVLGFVNRIQSLGYI